MRNFDNCKHDYLDAFVACDIVDIIHIDRIHLSIGLREPVKCGENVVRSRSNLWGGGVLSLFGYLYLSVGGSSHLVD